MTYQKSSTEKPKRVHTGIFERRLTSIVYQKAPTYKTITEYYLVDYELVLGAKKTHHFWIKTPNIKELTIAEYKTYWEKGYRLGSNHNITFHMAKGWIGMPEERINLLEFRTWWG